MTTQHILETGIDFVIPCICGWRRWLHGRRHERGLRIVKRVVALLVRHVPHLIGYPWLRLLPGRRRCWFFVVVCHHELQANWVSFNISLRRLGARVLRLMSRRFAGGLKGPLRMLG